MDPLLEGGDQLLALGHQAALLDCARVEPLLHRVDQSDVLGRDLRVELDRDVLRAGGDVDRRVRPDEVVLGLAHVAVARLTSQRADLARDQTLETKPWTEKVIRVGIDVDHLGPASAQFASTAASSSGGAAAAAATRSRAASALRRRSQAKVGQPFTDALHEGHEAR